MATQTRERDLVIKVVPAEVNIPTVQVSNEVQKAGHAGINNTESALSSNLVGKALAVVSKQLAAVYVSLSRPPATDRGRIMIAMAKAEHDRFISFLR